MILHITTGLQMILPGVKQVFSRMSEGSEICQPNGNNGQ
jgi:hypothetical protein